MIILDKCITKDYIVWYYPAVSRQPASSAVDELHVLDEWLRVHLGRNISLIS